MKDIMAGVDLHSNNLMLALVDRDGKRVAHQKLACEMSSVEQALAPYRKRINTIAVESTFNWYWLVDGLMALKYQTVLANPAAIQQYEGIKHTDDKHDAFWIAEMLRLGILPTGYICDPMLRPVRDILRRRLSLVRKRVALILSLKSLHLRVHGQPLSLSEVKRMEVDEIWRLFRHPADQLFAREELRLIRELDVSIERLEEQALKRAVKMPEYDALLSIPGIGKILGMTIALETGDPRRFASAGDFASYARTVRSERSSNGKKKGENNAKCGNKYLAWAFIEAANFATRYDAQAQAFYQRKKAKTNTMVATKALACKLAKAAWHVMRKRTRYDGQRVFGGPPDAGSTGPAPRAEKKAAGSRTVSFSQKTEVERGREQQAGPEASPVENSQLSDQAALRLHSCRAVSSAGKKQGKPFTPARQSKRTKPM
jgi:transposase